MKKLIIKYRYEIVIAIILIAFTILTFSDVGFFNFFSSREDLQAYIISYGAAAPLIIILATIAEVIITPIPGSVLTVTAGFLFGPLLGSIYAYAGNIIGTLMLFFLARHFGRYIISKLFKEQRLKRYEKVIARHENILLALYFFPLFPLDVITAAFGLSAIKLRKFVPVIMLGYVSYVVLLNLFGDYLARKFF